MKNDLAIFEGYGIRRRSDDKTETGWFSTVAHCSVLAAASSGLKTPFHEVSYGR